MQFHAPRWDHRRVRYTVFLQAVTTILTVLLVLALHHWMGESMGTAIALGVIPFTSGTLAVLLLFVPRLYALPVEKYQEEFEATYGRTNLDVRSLPFPWWKPRAGAQVSLGSSEVRVIDGDRATNRKVELAWDGEQFQLFENGRRLLPLTSEPAPAP